MLGTGYVFLLDREMASASFNSDNNSICMHCQLGQSCYCSLHRSLSCPPLDLCFVVEPSQSLDQCWQISQMTGAFAAVVALRFQQAISGTCFLPACTCWPLLWVLPFLHLRMI
jgi:hypothetical protein